MAFSKITRIILFVIAGISLLVVLFFFASPKTVNTDELEARVQEAQHPADLNPVAPLPAVDSTGRDSTAVAENVTEQENTYAAAEVQETPVAAVKDILSGWEYLVYYRVDIALIWAYILVIITLIASVVFPLIAVISNPKALIRLLAILGGAAVLVVISYMLSSDASIDIIGYTGTDNSDPAVLKMIDTVLFVTYMLFGLALASILYAIASRAFK